MKTILLLSLLVLCTSATFACLDSTTVEDEKACSHFTLQKMYLRPCPFGEKCGTEAIDSPYTYCESLGILKFHGDSCDINADCYSNNCLNTTCVSKADGESCKEDYECGTHSFCIKSSCTRYATNDDTCSSDLKCAFGYVCADPGDGTMKCIEQYSVKAGSKASDQNVCEFGFSKNETCIIIK